MQVLAIRLMAQLYTSLRTANRKGAPFPELAMIKDSTPFFQPYN